MSDDIGGKDGLRRDRRPNSVTCSIDICRSATTNDACSSTPRTHQGTCSPHRRRIHEVRSYCSFLSCRSECLLACCPAELGSIDPHAMQDHSALAGECDLGEFGAAPFCKKWGRGKTMAKRKTCGGCGTKEGQLHILGVDMERCP